MINPKLAMNHLSKYCLIFSLALVQFAAAQNSKLPSLSESFRLADLVRKPVNSDSILASTKNLFYSLENKNRNKKEDTLIVLASERLAYLYYNSRIPQKNADSMLLYSEKLLKYATIIKYNSQIFRAYDYISIAYTIKTDYQKALDVSLDSYKLSQNLKGNDLILTTYPLSRIAASYQLLRDYQNSLVYHQKALEIIKVCEQNDLKTGITTEKLNKWHLTYTYKYDDIGVIYAEQKQFKEALKYYQMGLKHTLEGKNSKAVEMIQYMEIGRCQIGLNQLQEGLANVKKSLQYFEETNNKFYAFVCYHYLAKAAYSENNFELAFQYTKKSETLAQAAMAIKHEIDNYEIQYLSAKNLKNYDLALDAYEKFNKMNDSITNRRKLAQVLSLQKRMETEKEKAESDRKQLIQKATIDSSLRANEILILKSQNSETERLALFEKNQNDELARKLQVEQLKANAEKTQFIQQNKINKLNIESERKQQTQQFLWVGLGMLGLLLFSLGFNYQIIRKRKKETELLNLQLEEKVKERTAELQKSYDEIKEAMQRGQSLERKRMAADLHDNLGSLLTAINISLDNINAEHLSEKERKIYANILSMTEDAYSEVRILSHNLMPEELEKEGLANALKRMIQKINLNKNIHFELIINELQFNSKTIDLNIYAICLEMVQNIIKHSRATKATISLFEKGNHLWLEVIDNGKGIDPTKEKGIGLKNIKNRLESLDGELFIDSEIGKGTKLVVSVPLEIPQLFHDKFTSIQ
jgi:signal transduction histidine kinase